MVHLDLCETQEHAERLAALIDPFPADLVRPFWFVLVSGSMPALPPGHEAHAVQLLNLPA